MADGAVEAALRSELAGMGAVANSPLAAAALLTARALDDGQSRMPDLLGEFRQYLSQLRELAPVKAKDGVSDIRAARAARRSA
jgi:hypothetical protein